MMRCNSSNMLRQAARTIDPRKDRGAYAFSLIQFSDHIEQVRDGTASKRPLTLSAEPVEASKGRREDGARFIRPAGEPPLWLGVTVLLGVAGLGILLAAMLP